MTDRFTSDPLDPAGTDLERYVRDTDVPAPAGLAERVMAAVAQEPIPRRGPLAGLLSFLFGGAASGPARFAAVGAVVALGVAAALIVSDASKVLREGNAGTSPPPAVTQPATPMPITTPTPTPIATPRPSPTSSRSPARRTPPASIPPAPSAGQATPIPGVINVTPQPSLETSETPHPSETPGPSDSGGGRGHG
ncbi:MAG: hypothetical protein DLM71_02205 [Chloroflexi bacterium]|nr:MAG: hypothetical protein DLM71_02205 [Chloroflexota bacterium]